MNIKNENTQTERSRFDKEGNASRKRIPVGTLGILYAALSGRFSNNPGLKRDLSYFLLLHLFSLTLAFLSAWLGYTRSLSFCMDFDHAESIALGLTIFIAGSAYVFVSRALGQVGYRLQGGRFSKGQWGGVVISLMLAVSVISLDLYINFSSIEPIADGLTQGMTESQSEAIMARYDTLISQTEEKIKAMEAKHFTYREKVFVPDRPTSWVSQEILDQYAGLQHELTLFRSIKTQELSNDAQKVATDQGRYKREKVAKVDVLSLLVGLIYFLMMLAAMRAGMYVGAVWRYFEEENEEAWQLSFDQEGMEKPVSPEMPINLNGKEIEKRGINQEKYQHFLKIAAEVLQDRGRYVKVDIARRAGLARDTVTTYLNHGLETGDLENV